MNDMIDKAIERFNEYNNAQSIYIYFNPLDAKYLSEYFNMDINKNKRTEIDNYILVPMPLMAGGVCYISERDFQNQGFEKSSNREWLSKNKDKNKWWEPELSPWQEIFLERIKNGKKI